MTCRHCQLRHATRPRGLCWLCYESRKVRSLYPSTSKFGRRGVGLNCHAGKPQKSTSAPPGTAERVEVMAARAERGEELWHDRDSERDDKG